MSDVGAGVWDGDRGQGRRRVVSSTCTRALDARAQRQHFVARMSRSEDVQSSRATWASFRE